MSVLLLFLIGPVMIIGCSLLLIEGEEEEYRKSMRLKGKDPFPFIK